MKDTPETELRLECFKNGIQVNDVKVYQADTSLKVPLRIFVDQTHLRNENHAIHLIIWSFTALIRQFIKNFSVSIGTLF